MLNIYIELLNFCVKPAMADWRFSYPLGGGH
jgi:hypothetical protein